MHFHVLIHTFFPSLPIPPLSSHPCHLNRSTGRPTSTFLHSRCPNHLNLPCLTTSDLSGVVVVTPLVSSSHIISTNPCRIENDYTTRKNICRHNKKKFVRFSGQLIFFISTNSCRKFVIRDILLQK